MASLAASFEAFMSVYSKNIMIVFIQKIVELIPEGSYGGIPGQTNVIGV